MVLHKTSLLNTEEHFIKRLRDPTSKEAAYKELLGIYTERLYWHIRHIVKTHDNANDVLQNTFIKVYKNMDHFKGNSKLFSWMYRIATNESLTYIKKNTKHLLINSEETQAFLMNNLEADVYFKGDDIQLKLQKAITRLPEKQQLVFNMRYFQNIKYKNLAEILDTSEGALKASYHIAVKKIEAYLTQD